MFAPKVRFIWRGVNVQSNLDQKKLTLVHHKIPDFGSVTMNPLMPLHVSIHFTVQEMPWHVAQKLSFEGEFCEHEPHKLKESNNVAIMVPNQTGQSSVNAP